jgi:hypothetical protein
LTILKCAWTNIFYLYDSGPCRASGLTCVYLRHGRNMGASGKGMSDLAGPVVFPFSSINHLRLFPQLASSHFLKFFLDELSSAGLSAQTRLRPRPLARIDGQRDEAEEQGGIPQTAPTTMTTSGSQPLSTAGPTRWALPDVLFGAYPF